MSMPEALPSWRRLAAQLHPRVMRHTCSNLSAQLPLFVSDELAGYDVDALYPHVAAALDDCLRCFAEYATLSRLLKQALSGDDAGEWTHE